MQLFVAITEVVIVCMSEPVESNLANITERSESDDRHLARFQSQKIDPSYHSLIDP